MDFSSWQTWGLIALGVVAILWLIGTIFGDKNVAEPAPYTQSKPHATLPTQVAMMAAMTATVLPRFPSCLQAGGQARPFSLCFET